MSAQGLSMKKVKEILRLKYDAKLTHRQIGKSLNISASTVSRCVTSAQAHGLSWPLPDAMDEASLERLIYGLVSDSTLDLLKPDFAYHYTEYQKHKHVRVQLQKRAKSVLDVSLFTQFITASVNPHLKLVYF